ncbi:hypothetical protein B0H67DRAFT_646251 [Lasiosphaeris hirsuta]|uniref:Uncharacterized protein n=1 Tax=Lasiosphaeris hirsuta TaxID=260670 RepID=A0AA40DPI0_9PEZI|nr:hypothetical protein B0H67DRAFT_646251 [Lasiosphaeris hirsuta]
MSDQAQNGRPEFFAAEIARNIEAMITSQSALIASQNAKAEETAQRIVALEKAQEQKIEHLERVIANQALLIEGATERVDLLVGIVAKHQGDTTRQDSMIKEVNECVASLEKLLAGKVGDMEAVFELLESLPGIVENLESGPESHDVWKCNWYFPCLERRFEELTKEIDGAVQRLCSLEDKHHKAYDFDKLEDRVSRLESAPGVADLANRVGRLESASGITDLVKPGPRDVGPAKRFASEALGAPTPSANTIKRKKRWGRPTTPADPEPREDAEDALAARLRAMEGEKETVKLEQEP